jgi:hypothetical protein
MRVLQIPIVLFSLLALFYSIFNQIQSQDFSSSHFANFNYLNKEINTIQFFSKTQRNNFSKILSNSSKKKIHVLHLGDSHVQNDIYPSKIRENLQSILGDGGRGFVFPYSVAKTYSPLDYSSIAYRHWENSKSYQNNPLIPIGLIGMSIRTFESDGEITFQFQNEFPKHYNFIKLFTNYRKSLHNSIYLITNEKEFNLTEFFMPNKNIFEIETDLVSRQITILIDQEEQSKSGFQFYGMSIESDQNQGLIWHNCGVGSAKFSSILNQKLFMSHLKSLEIDLIILDFGTNDIYGRDSISTSLEKNIITIIDNIRSVNKNIFILLSSTNDMIYKNKPLSSPRKFSELLQKIAKNKKTFFYDYFEISGGESSIQNWREDNLMSKDLIHLTKSGYRLKGDMFSDAFFNTFLKEIEP